MTPQSIIHELAGRIAIPVGLGPREIGREARGAIAATVFVVGVGYRGLGVRRFHAHPIPEAAPGVTPRDRPAFPVRKHRSDSPPRSKPPMMSVNHEPPPIIV